jgi:Fic family protein
MERRLNTEKLNVYSAEFISWLHQEFYHHLPEEMHWSESFEEKRHRIYPGKIRDFDVRVGRHDPPLYSALQSFLERFDSGYNHPNILATNRLIVAAAAHHRLLWIHPFGDGNGRVCRLQTHACLMQAKVDSLGLWTLSRGLARHRDDYYNFLANADLQRTDDLDGRGNLSERNLAAFCEFFLKIVLDQIRFMATLLNLADLSERIHLHIQRERPRLRECRDEVSRLLKAFLIEGEIARGRVPEIIGRNEATAVKVIKLILAEDLAETPSPKGRLSIKFPAEVLDSYFPRLFLDIPLDA